LRWREIKEPVVEPAAAEAGETPRGGTEGANVGGGETESGAEAAGARAGIDGGSGGEGAISALGSGLVQATVVRLPATCADCRAKTLNPESQN
jgi:hypothetical protein